ncbi:IDEAL domain-containing protein [Paenibacillus campi]|uniref:IDEAL domain-containing protein n=1 Tax=Paenibacillus campi TaxID=3106031 RepID=UPI002AFE6EDF|nr:MULTISPECIES: IDEAL domain-containing protein [unclassified Paenibacillus]
MITLNEKQIYAVLHKQLNRNFPVQTMELQYHIEADSRLVNHEGEVELTNKHYWVKVMDCVYPTHSRPILMSEVIYFLRQEYMDSTIRVFMKQETDGSILATAEISFQDHVTLEAEQLKALIDLALVIKDREWFDELTQMYLTMTRPLPSSL